MDTRFGKNVIINPDGTGVTMEERLDRALRDPSDPTALTQNQVRGVTQNRIRSAMAELAHGQIAKVAGWIEQTATGIKDDNGAYITRPNPAEAVQLFLAAAEYSLPKLKSVSIDVRDNGGDCKTYNLKDLQSIVAEQ